MKERRRKVHYSQFGVTSLCGLPAPNDHAWYSVNDTTCRVCMFRYLAGQAPWAQGFLDELRGRIGDGQPAAVIIPATTAEPVDAVIESPSNALGRPFRNERGSEKAIRELLPPLAPFGRTIQPVMDDGGAPADAVRVQGRDISYDPGDAGQISYEPRRYRKYSE